MRTRRASTVGVLASCALVLLGAVVWAAWLLNASGTTRASATTVGAGNAPTASVTSRTVTLTWPASTLATGAAVAGYEIRRYDAAGTVRQTIASGTCASVVTGTTCTQTATPPGTWRWSVSPAQGNWRGAESATTSATVGAPTLVTSPARIRPGATVTGTVSNLIAGETLRFRLNSPTGTELPGTFDGGATPTAVPSSGAGNVSITVPSNTPDGNHTLYAVTSPSADHATSPVAVETALPAPTITSGPSGPTNSTSASFSFSTSPTPARYACSLDGAAATTCTSPTSYTGLAQGSHTFVVTAFSATGMPSDPTTRTWIADTVAPTGATTAPANGSTVGVASYTAACSTPSDGDICGTAGDGSAGSGVVKVEVSAVRDSGTKWYDATARTFSGGTQIWYLASGTTSWSYPIPTSALGDFSYTVHLRVTDAVGLVTANTITFRADVTAPTATVTAPAAATTYGAAKWLATCSTAAAEDLCGTAADAGSGVAKVEWVLQRGGGSYWDGTGFASPNPVRTAATGTTSWSSPWPFSRFPADGAYTLTAYSTDGAGNGSAGTSTTFTVDSTAPTAVTTFPAAAAVYSATTWSNGCSTTAEDVCGSAADAGGAVTRAEVSIQQGSGNYWNGTSFVTAETWLTATGTTSWSYAFASTSFPADGSYTVRARSTDAGGNVSPVTATTFSVDRVAPTTTLTSTPPSPSTSSSATIAFTTDDASATTTCRLDAGAATACTSPVSYSGLADGSHTVTVTATDPAGNAGATSYTWTVDTTAPAVAVTFPADGASTYGLSAYTAGCSTGTDDMCGTAGDATSGLSTVRVSLRRVATGLWWDGSAFASASAVPVAPSGTTTWTWPFAGTSFPADGGYELTARATDAAGHAATVTRAFTVDVSAPSAPTITASPTSPTSSRTASVSFTHTEAGTTFSCRLDAGTAAACTSPVTYSGLSDGSHTVAVTAADAAGNVSAAATVSWTVDGTAPTATASMPANGTSYNAATWTAGCGTSSTDDVCGTVSDGTGTGVAGVRISLRQGSGAFWDGSAFTSSTEVLFNASVSGSSWSWPFASASFPTDGSYTLRVAARDTLENTGSVSSVFTIDRAAPAAPSITAGPSAATNSTTASFSFSSEAGATFTCTLDGASAACTSPRAYSGLAEGNHTFSVSATDAAGNTGAAATWTWTVDTTAPSSSTDFPMASSYTRADWDAGCATVGGDACGTATDGRSGVSEVAVSLREVSTGLYWNGSSFAGTTETFTAAGGTTAWTWAFPASSFAAAGDYAMTVRTRDVAGNASTSSRTFTVTSSIALVKASATGAACPGTTNTVTVPTGGFAVGNTVIARVVLRKPVAGSVTIADTRGNTWTRDADTDPSGAPNVRVVVFSTNVTTALLAGDTITFTLPSNDGSAAVAVEWSGIAATGRLDGTPGVTSGTGTTPSVSVTRTNAADLVLGVTGAAGGASLATQSSGFTASTSASACSGGNAVSMLAAYRLPFQAGTSTYSPTLSASTNYAATVVAYRAQ